LKIVFLLVLMLSTSLTYSQNNITNTLGASGIYYIKDATSNYFTVTQSTGSVNILKSLRLELTGNSSTVGVIFKGTNRFLHDFAPIGSNGENLFLGLSAGNFTMSASTATEASRNTGIGDYALWSISTGSDNTAIGNQSLFYNSTGSDNTAIGRGSMYKNSTGSYNTALGSSTLYYNTTGNYSTAMGYRALERNDSGIDNSAFGCNALSLNTSGNNNTAFGSNVLFNNTVGFDNTGIGYLSLFTNSGGYRNTAIGSNALKLATLGNENTANGFSSLYNNTTGDRNSALGKDALYSNTTGNYNSAFGYQSLFNNDNGDMNTAIGYSAGSSITTGSNLTIIGYNSEPSAAYSSNQITLGNASVVSLRCAVQSISSLSDKRDKKNIRELDLGIGFLMKIKPRLFYWDKREWYENGISDGSKMSDTPTAGFIAQELNEVQMEQNAEWLNLVLKDNPEKLEATPGNLFPILVKALQDLKIENDELKAETEVLREKLNKLDETQQFIVKELNKIKMASDFVEKVSLINP